MSRSHEAFREGGEIDWYERGIRDAEIQDALDSDPPTEPRFYTPVSVPVIPPVQNEDYNAFDHMSEDDFKAFKAANFIR